MADKKITLDVELKSQLQNIRGIFNETKQQGAYNGPGGKEARTRIAGYIGSLEKLLKNVEVDAKTFEEINQIFKNIFKDLERFSAKASKVSAEVLKLNDDLSKRSEQLSKNRAKLNKAKESRADLFAEINKAGQSNTFWKKTKNGNISKQQLTDPETILKNYKAGTLGIRNQIGEEIGLSSPIFGTLKQINDSYEDLNIKIKNLDNSISVLEDSIQQTSNKIKAQVQSDKKAGKSDSPDSLVETIGIKTKTNEILDRGFTTFSNQKQIETISQDAIQTSAKLTKQTSALNRAFKQFTLYAIIIRSVKTALREAVQTIKELDKYLTEQAMVTGMTREQTYGLVKEYQNLASQVGATTKEIASVATEYLKQGKTIKDSLTLTKAAVSAAKVARVSVGDSVNYLTTALNGFRLSAEDAMKVSDKFAAVAAASATDYDELAIALSKVASQANLAGMSIDYTTALLTKGLETTREAPETMGTALKTIIARMRELSDYGETLEGDTDINNVESQLAYVGIALKDANGELRSTEDVLDELGKKWDTLNKNQQAALAKALAGTRQQSRLIAMMDDYERVLELQQISERSAGATSAQAATYLEGIEAKMNKIQVAWEKIVMTVSDSEIIIGIFDLIGSALDEIDTFLNEQVIGIPILVTAITTAVVGLLAKRQVENQIAKEQLKLAREQQIIDLQRRNEEIVQTELQKQGLTLDAAATKAAIAQYNALKAQGKQIIANNKAKKEKHTSNNSKAVTGAGETEIKEAIEAQGEYQKALTNTDVAIGKITSSNAEYKANLDTINALQAQNNNLMQFSYIILAAQNIAGQAHNALLSIRNMIISRSIAQKNRDIIATTGQSAAEAGLATTTWGVVAANLAALLSNPFTWAIAGVAIAAITAMTIAIHKYADSTENVAKKNSELANEIYKSTKNAEKIDEITSKYDALDQKLIKTNKDLKEMNSLLESGAELLDTEDDNWHGTGKTEKDWYEGLDNTSKRVYLTTKAEQENKQAEDAMKKIVSNIARHRELLENSSDNEFYAETRAQLVSANNTLVYSKLDNLNLSLEETQALQDLTAAMFENMDAQDLLTYVNSKRTETMIEDLAKLKRIQVGEDNYASVADILISDDYDLVDKAKAYTEALGTLDSTSQEIFKKTFSGYEYLAELNKTNHNVLEFIDTIGLSIDELNELYASWEKLNKRGIEISKEEFESKFKNYLSVLAETQGDAVVAAQVVYGQYIKTAEDMNAFISMYGDLVEVGILNMGQNIDKLKNSINNFYEKSTKWKTMSESEKAEFINDNAALFAEFENDNGENTLLQAFETGDYDQIRTALANNEALQKQVEQRRKEVEQELMIEEAKTGSERNEAYIAQLKAYKAYLDNTEELFQASLEIRLEQEQKQIDEYRSYLEDQQKALEDSLNKRKEAYEKYFDNIKENEEEEEYEEQADLLVRNLSKLGSSTNASAIQQTKELEQQLEDLEEERLKELRERAQEAVLEQMDDTLEEINDKFDKLLESNQALLAAMQGELENPTEFITELLSNKIESGATALETQDFFQSLQGTYGSVLGNNVDWDQFKIHEENNQLFLTVNGQTVSLDTNNEQNLYKVIMKALREIGMR